MDETGPGGDAGVSRAAGITRRDLIGRAAAVGAVAWSAPLIVSTPAGAAGGAEAGTVRPCSRFYAVRMTRGRCHPLFPERPGSGGAGNAQGTGDVCDEILAWADANPEIVLEFPAVCPTLVASDPHMAWAVLLPFSDADPGAGCSLLAAYGRAGNECCEGYVDPAPPDPADAGRRIILPQCATGQLSSVQIVYCCP